MSRVSYFTQIFGFEEIEEDGYDENQQALQRQATITPVTEVIPGVAQYNFYAEKCTFRTPQRGHVEAGVSYSPTLKDLREYVHTAYRTLSTKHTHLHDYLHTMKTNLGHPPINSVIRNITGESRAMHTEPENHGAVIQAASQFNLLEFPGPRNVPEEGITQYIYDRTQGPACAIACGAGTAYRNYLMPTPHFREGEPRGQRSESQLNCLDEVEKLVKRKFGGSFWTTKNGYVDSTPEQLNAFNEHFNRLSLQERDELVDALRIGVQQDTQVTDPTKIQGSERAEYVDAKVLVTQTYNSAISCGYSRKTSTDQWANIARVVLDGTYEATVLVGVLQTLRAAAEGKTNAPRILLTKVGGGVFKNDPSWIQAAINRAVDNVTKIGVPLNISVVHYGEVEQGYQAVEMSRVLVNQR